MNCVIPALDLLGELQCCRRCAITCSRSWVLVVQNVKSVKLPKHFRRSPMIVKDDWPSHRVSSPLKMAIHDRAKALKSPIRPALSSTRLAIAWNDFHALRMQAAGSNSSYTVIRGLAAGNALAHPIQCSNTHENMCGHDTVFQRYGADR